VLLRTSNLLPDHAKEQRVKKSGPKRRSPAQKMVSFALCFSNKGFRDTPIFNSKFPRGAAEEPNCTPRHKAAAQAPPSTGECGRFKMKASLSILRAQLSNLTSVSILRARPWPARRPVGKKNKNSSGGGGGGGSSGGNIRCEDRMQKQRVLLPGSRLCYCVTKEEATCNPHLQRRGSGSVTNERIESVGKKNNPRQNSRATNRERTAVEDTQRQPGICSGVFFQHVVRPW